jgi:folate-dependent phosphoribosylglycinamide formyltransferase PurN
LSRTGVTMVATDSPGTWMLFGALDRAVGVDHVVIEDRIGARAVMAARARRLGWPAVAGQAAFRVVVMPFLALRARRRAAEIAERSGLAATRAPDDRVTRVPSVNDPAAVAALRELAPRVVVVSGTRIIRSAVLDAVGAPFLNVHAGMTPRYRGVHGGYWALAAGDPDHCGVTVHVLDSGVDTGDVVAQARIEPTARDNFATYPLLQLVAGVPLLVDAVTSALDGRLEHARVEGPSRQWYHPTIWGYLGTRLRAGVR